MGVDCRAGNDDHGHGNFADWWLAMSIQLLNEDCMVVMARYPDKYFDLACVDPPYGLGEKITSGGTWAAKLTKADSAWDTAPTK